MLWITIFCFGTLAASVFIKHFLVYVAIICCWSAVIFWPGSEFPDYLKIAALSIICFSIWSIFRIWRRGDNV